MLQDQGTVKRPGHGAVRPGSAWLLPHLAPDHRAVGLRLVDPGNVVQATGTVTLVVITQVQPITVIFTIAEDTLGQVQPRLRQSAKLCGGRLRSWRRRRRSRAGHC